MHILVIGFNYKITSLALREVLAFDREAQVRLGRALTNQEVIEECFILSTCNRTEVYTTGPCIDGMREAVYQTLSETTTVGAHRLTGASYCLQGIEALQHLFRVASSLDAMVVGEAQVLGQFKAAYQTASEYGMVGAYLHKACHAAFRVAKRVRTETDIAALPVSSGSLAAELAKETIGCVDNKAVLIIGAGEMSTLVATHLKEKGATHLWVTNRSHAAADALAHTIGGVVVPFEEWKAHLRTADIAVSSVAGGMLIRKIDVEEAITDRNEIPLVLIDLAIPRNIEETAAKLPSVRLFNIDDLQGIAEKNLLARKDAAAAAEKIVVEEAESTFKDLKHIKLAPLLERLQKKCVSIMESELDDLFSIHPQFSDEEKESISRCAESIVKKILHDPIRQSKEELVRPGTSGAEFVEALHRIFRIEGN